LTYSNLLKMKVHPTNPDENAEEKKRRVGILKSSFDQKFGAENVSYDEKTDFFAIKAVEKVCGVSTNGRDQWKFVTLKKDVLR
ncbi:MAG: hypothetical protein AAGG02_06745, partial [Cyanobacteria bacterium P01_H01_bin.15]